LDIQSDIDLLNPSNDLRASVEDMCDITISLYRPAMQGNDSQKISQADNNHHRPISNLPKVNLPKFSGKYADFKNFISLFESLVYNDASLTNVEKFDHLLFVLLMVR